MNKIKTYTAIDFQQYHTGTMPAMDMHALEKAALEDPFLADALDGYEHTINTAVEIEAIKQKLPPHKEEEKGAVIAYNKKLWMRVAASVALFMGVGVLFFNLNNKKATESIAKNEVKSEQNIDTNKIAANDSATIINIHAGSYTTEGTIAQNTIKATDIVIQMEPLKTTNGLTQNTQSNTFSYTPAPIASESKDLIISPSENETKEKATEKLEFAKYNNDTKTDSINYRNEVAKSLRRDANVDNNLTSDRTQLFNNNATQNGFYNYNFSGVVKTPAGGPMQNATLKMRNNNTLIKTDNNGRFNFVANDSTATVSVIAPGYANRDLTLNGTALAQPLAVNSTSSKLEEVVVVTGYSTNAKKKSVSQSVTTIKAEALAKNTKPVNLNNAINGKISGVQVEDKEDDKFAALWGETKSYKVDSISFKNATSNFKTYVIKNIVPQFDEKGNEYKGKVILSFTTNKKGAPRKIKVVQSLNKKCDAHAKKLLENGPVWQINNDSRNTVTIEF